MKDNITETSVPLHIKVTSYLYTAGFGMVLCLMSTALVGGIIGGLIMLSGGM